MITTYIRVLGSLPVSIQPERNIDCMVAIIDAVHNPRVNKQSLASVFAGNGPSGLYYYYYYYYIYYNYYYQLP